MFSTNPYRLIQNSENNWKHSCFRWTAAHRDFFDYYLLTYLLTYLYVFDFLHGALCCCSYF